VVPLMMARSSRIRFAARSSVSGAISGMPRRPPPRSAAPPRAARQAAPAAAVPGDHPLVGRDHRFFRSKASAISARAGSSPPITSITRSTSSAWTTEAGSPVSTAGSTPRSRERSRTAARWSTSGTRQLARARRGAPRGPARRRGRRSPRPQADADGLHRVHCTAPGVAEGLLRVCACGSRLCHRMDPIDETPISRKLGIKEGRRVLLMDPPVGFARRWIRCRTGPRWPPKR